MIRRPPRSTLSSSSAASDVYKRQLRVRAILALYDEMKRRVADITRSQYAIHALDWLFERPVFKSTDFVSAAGIPAATAKRLLAVLREEGILAIVSEGRGRRPALLVYPELLRVAGSRAANLGDKR